MPRLSFHTESHLAHPVSGSPLHLYGFDISLKTVKEKLPGGSCLINLQGCMGANLCSCASEGWLGRISCSKSR